MNDSGATSNQEISNEAPPKILAKVYFHPLPEEDDYEVHDEKCMSGDCLGCIPAYIVPREYVDKQTHPIAELALKRLIQDRDGQRAMKAKAREQRDAMTLMLAGLVKTVEEVIKASEGKHDAWDAVKIAIAKARGSRQ